MKKALVVFSLAAMFLVFGFVLLTMPASQVAGATTSVVAPIGDTKSRVEVALDREIEGPVWLSPLKVGIKNAVSRGVSVNTILLLLLFPLTAALVAFSRQVIGLTGYGIFIPALISVAFLSTGVLAGLVLLLTIIIAAVATRFLIRKVKLPYLPRMAVLIWAIVMAVLALLLLSPTLALERLVGLGIYPVLLFIMLAESNIEAQITRTWQTAALMTAETIGIAIVASLLMGTVSVQEWVLLNPEMAVLLILAADGVIGSYRGLRLLEIWRFKKILKG
ncbi:MAG: 7TM domain-containing protein [Microgenomates group bacterium]